MEAIAKHPWPTVAAINGHCLGGGLELAITCDLRICAAGAQLGMPPAKLGLIYGHTGLRKFLDVIGLARTKELFLTGRNYSAARAERFGLVNEVVDDDRLGHEAVQLAAAIAANAPLSMRGNKSAINLLNASPELSPQQEAGLVALRESCFSSADLREGIRAFAEKRRPQWTGRMSAAARELAAADPTMAALIERIGEIDLAMRLRRRAEERPADAYGALLRAIVGQQLSTKAARTIYLRVLELFDGTTPSPEQLLAASEEDLRGAGLSGRKVEYVRDLARHVLDGELELDRLDQLGDEQVIEEIVAVRGLGQWTAEMFLLFHLRRPDVLSGGDLGIRKAIQVEYGLERDADPAARCWRSASPGAPTAASPRSTSGSRWPTRPTPEARPAPGDVPIAV